MTITRENWGLGPKAGEILAAAALVNADADADFRALEQADDGTWPCPNFGCRRTFDTEGALKRHCHACPARTGPLPAAADPTRPHACPDCPNTYSNASKLEAHRRIHTPTICPRCATPMTEATLARHRPICPGPPEGTP